MKKNKVESFNDFMNRKQNLLEAEAYDEPESSPSASIRQEDWDSKDKLKNIYNILDELIILIEDGEELENSQVSIINQTFKAVNLLKGQIEGRQKIKDKEEEDLYNDLDNPNL